MIEKSIREVTALSLLVLVLINAFLFTGCQQNHVLPGNGKIDSLSDAEKSAPFCEYMLPPNRIFSSDHDSNQLITRFQNLEDDNSSAYSRALHELEQELVMESGLWPIAFNNFLYLERMGVKGLYNDPYGNFYFDQVYFDRNDSLVGDQSDLKIYLGSEHNRPDPTAAGIVNNQTLTAMTHAGLFRFSSNGKIVFDIAEQISSNKDQTIWRINLRTDRRWSNQNVIQVEDFVNSWVAYDRLVKMEPFLSFFKKLKRHGDQLYIEADSKKNELVLHFNKTVSQNDLLNMFAQPFTYPVNLSDSGKDIGLADLEAQANSVFSGPYRVSNYKRGEVMDLVANTNYPSVDARVKLIRIMLNNDDLVAYEAFQNKLLDVDLKIPPEKYVGLVQNQNANLRSVPVRSLQLLEFNSWSKSFSDLSQDKRKILIKSLQNCIDYGAVIDEGQRPADALIMDGMIDKNGLPFKQNNRNFIYPVDTGYFDKANVNLNDVIKYLESKGFVFNESHKLVGVQDAAGRPVQKLNLNLTLIAGKGQIAPGVLAQWVRLCRRLGVEIKLEYVRPEIFRKRYTEADYDIAVYNYRLFSPLAEDVLGRWVETVR